MTGVQPAPVADYLASAMTGRQCELLTPSNSGLRIPLDGLIVGERPEPQAPPGWVVVSLTHAAVNPHPMCGP